MYTYFRAANKEGLLDIYFMTRPEQLTKHSLIICLYFSDLLFLESGAESDTSSSKRTALSIGSATQDGDTSATTSNWEEEQVSPC